MPADIVITTIGDGSFLDRMASALVESDVRLIVIPDRKIPAALFQRCEHARQAGATILCPDVETQERLLAKLRIPDLIPYDSDNRRNIGYLMSWLDGSDMVISMDDDNFPVGQPFVAEHRAALSGPADRRLVSTASGWFNACDLLTVSPLRVFPRGFPYGPRQSLSTEVRERIAEVDVHVNAGLWLGDPDVDAVTRAAARPDVVGFSGAEAVLDDDTWCPVNSQNTAIHREALPAYYFLRMGQSVGGLRIERFGDIFSGYFVQACAKYLGHTVRFGGPLVHHARNYHDLLDDLAAELPAIRMTDDVIDWLREYRLDGADYLDAYESLSYGLQEFAERVRGRAWDADARAFLHRSAYLMRNWISALRRSGVG